MNIAFSIPNTPTIGVEYMKGGVKYAAVIKNPGNNDGLQMVMLTRGVGMSQIIAPLRPIQPAVPINRMYAGHRAAQYQRVSEQS